MKGDVLYQTDVTIRNQSGGPADVRLYRAADCYLQDDDYGFGRMQPGFSVACVAPTRLSDGTYVPGSWVEEWAPLSFGAFMFEGYYGALWSTIGRQEPFIDNTDALDTRIDNSAGLNWNFTLQAGAERTYSHVLRITDTLACSGQSLDHQTPDDRVVVRYDPRFLWPQKDPAFEARAGEIASAIQARAIASLNEYRTLGFPVDDLPDPLVINVRCDFPFFIPSGVPGWTGDRGVIDLRADRIKTYLAGYVSLPPQQRPGVAGTPWANLIDHELVHTFQIQTSGQVGLLARILQADRANIEGTATAAEDLLSSTDDLHFEADQSFLGHARAFLGAPGQIDQVPDDGRAAYRVAPFFQYLGERFGDQGQPNLEQRVAAILREIYARQGSGGVYDATGRAESTIGALRDFLLTAYIREAGNKGSLPDAYRFLDEITASGQASGSGSGLPSWGTIGLDPQKPPITSSTPAILANQSLPRYQGRIYELALAAGIEGVRVTVTDHRPTFWRMQRSDPLELAFVPSTGFNGPGAGSVAFDPALRRLGPGAGRSQDYDVIVGGSDRLAIVVATGGAHGDYDITVTARTPGLALDPVAPVTEQGQSAGILLIARPTLDGEPAHGVTQARLSATIDGVTVPVTGAFEILSTGVYMVFLGPPSPYTAGSYPLTLRYGSATATGTLEVTSGGGASPLTVGGNGSIRTELTLGGAGFGGTPIEAGFVITDGGQGLAGATVVATLTGPGGLMRVVPLSDAGSAIDSGADDGAYGAYLYGTNAAGTYEVRVDATGIDRSGAPFAYSLSEAITLGSMIDVDGDGVADSLAAEWGAGGLDPDGDGASTAIELAAGSNPFVADSDGGGESDGTEIAAGRNPLLPDDDLPVPVVGLIADPLDGRLVEVSVAAFDGSTPVHVYRVSGGSEVDLGIFPGSSAQFTDGPLPAGTYSYVVVGEAANGARTVPVTSDDVEARDDAVPPSVAFYLNNDDFATNQPEITLTFIDLSEPVTEMRIAESEEALATAAWAPYSTQTTFALSPGDGVHELFAQVRDSSGLASGAASGFIILDTTPPASALDPLPATTAAPSIDLSFTAADASTGVSAVEVWARWRSTSASPWNEWAVAATTTVSPVSYPFPYGDGEYEFYTVALDGAGNREPAPAEADTRTEHAPSTGPVVQITAAFAIEGPPPLGGCDPICPDSLSAPSTYVYFEAAGTASHASATISGFDARLYGVRADESRELLFDWLPIGAADGTFDEKAEAFMIDDERPGLGYTWYDFEVRASAAGQSATAAQRVLIDRDTTDPVSVSGPAGPPLSEGVNVPITASDNRPGQLTVELWARHRPNAVSAWTSWSRYSSTSYNGDPSYSIFYLYGHGDGEYEFYSIAVDAAGNRESPPAQADTSAKRDAVNDPPAVSGSFAATKYAVGGGFNIRIEGGGTAVDDRSNVSVSWALYGVKANGQRARIFNFTPATSADRAFDERLEDYTVFDDRAWNSAHVSYSIDAKVSVAGASTTRTFAVSIIGP